MYIYYSFSYDTVKNASLIYKQPINNLPINIIVQSKLFNDILRISPKNELNLPSNKKLNIIMDTTFFHRDFGVLVLMDSNSKKVIEHYTVKTEKDIYYKIALNRLQKSYIIQSVTCNGRRKLLKELFDTPTQICQFHMIAIVMRKLRIKHKSVAGKELKIIVKTLTKSTKNEFYKALHLWYLKHQDFLNERSEYPNKKGYYPYKHREARGVYASLKRYQDDLFTFEKHLDLHHNRKDNK